MTQPRPDRANTSTGQAGAPAGAGGPSGGAGGSVVDRRSGLDRREAARVLSGQPTGQPAGQPAGQPGSAGAASDADGLERRRGPGRRLSDFSRAAEEGELTSEQFLFVMAIEQFKKSNARTFPTWTDVLEVVRLLGYRKTCPSEFVLRNAEDWTERPDTPSNVRPKDWDTRRAA